MALTRMATSGGTTEGPGGTHMGSCSGAGASLSFCPYNRYSLSPLFSVSVSVSTQFVSSVVAPSTWLLCLSLWLIGFESARAMHGLNRPMLVFHSQCNTTASEPPAQHHQQQLYVRPSQTALTEIADQKCQSSRAGGATLSMGAWVEGTGRRVRSRSRQWEGKCGSRGGRAGSREGRL